LRRETARGCEPSAACPFAVTQPSLRLLQRRLKAAQRAQHVRPERRLHQEAVGVKVARDAPLQAGVLAARAGLLLCSAARAYAPSTRCQQMCRQGREQHPCRRECHVYHPALLLCAPCICRNCMGVPHATSMCLNGRRGTRDTEQEPKQGCTAFLLITPPYAVHTQTQGAPARRPGVRLQLQPVLRREARQLGRDAQRALAPLPRQSLSWPRVATPKPAQRHHAQRDTVLAWLAVHALDHAARIAVSLLQTLCPHAAEGQCKRRESCWPRKQSTHAETGNLWLAYSLVPMVKVTG